MGVGNVLKGIASVAGKALGGPVGGVVGQAASALGGGGGGAASGKPLSGSGYDAGGAGRRFTAADEARPMRKRAMRGGRKLSGAR